MTRSQVIWSQVVTSRLIKMFSYIQITYTCIWYYLTINPAKMSTFDFVSWHFCLQILLHIHVCNDNNPDTMSNFDFVSRHFPLQILLCLSTGFSCHMMWRTIFKAFRRSAIDRWYCLGNEKVGSLFSLIRYNNKCSMVSKLL